MVEELVVAVISAAIAVAVFVVGDRVYPRAWRHDGDDAAGALVLDLIKTLFAAVAAFVIVICWQNYDNAHNRTAAEAQALVEVYATAHAMPDPEHHEIQRLDREYVRQVVDREWSVMDREHRLSPDAQATFDRLRDAVAFVGSDDQRVGDLRNSALTSVDQAGQARHDRALAAAGGMPGFLYAALWFGTVLLLLSPVLAGVRVSVRSVAMIALLGLVVGSAIVEIYNLDQPFSGGQVVPKDAFQLALSRFQQIG
jgi:hypothetical protein